jgi:hypothetical protein
MTDEQDEDAMFERLANTLRAVRQDAELVRSSGAEGIAAALARTEAELRSLTTGIEALHQRVAQQQAVTVRLEAAAAKGDADLLELRQTVEALSRRVVQQAESLAALSARKPRPRTAARFGAALAVLILVLAGGAAAWVASGREPTLGALAHLSVVRLSKLSGIDLAGTGEQTQRDAAVARAPASSPPQAPAAPTAAEAHVPADPPPTAAAPAPVMPPVAPASPVQASGTVPPPPAQVAAAVPVPPIQPPAAVPPAVQAPQAVTTAEAAAPPAAPPEPTAQAATAPPQPVPPLPVTQHQLALRATANAWVQVRQKDGHVLLSRTLKAGETWAVPAEPDLILDTGNADGLELVVNGAATRLTGAKGGVIHNVLLDADLARQGVAAQGVH